MIIVDAVDYKAQMRKLTRIYPPSLCTSQFVKFATAKLKLSAGFFFAKNFSQKNLFLVPLISHHSTPFKLSFLVTHWFSCLFLQLLSSLVLLACICVFVCKCVLVILGNQKMLFVWGQFFFDELHIWSKGRAASSSRKGQF